MSFLIEVPWWVYIVIVFFSYGVISFLRGDTPEKDRERRIKKLRKRADLLNMKYVSSISEISELAKQHIALMRSAEDDEAKYIYGHGLDVFFQQFYVGELNQNEKVELYRLGEQYLELAARKGARDKRSVAFELEKLKERLLGEPVF